MVSNVYTKNEILKNLAQRGYFIDAYTLDTFFEKWKVEAIFEDEQGSEFFDKNALELVLNNLFSAKMDEEKKEPEAEPVSLSSAPNYGANPLVNNVNSMNLNAVQPQQPQVQQFQPQAQPQVQPQTIQSQLQFQQPQIQPQVQPQIQITQPQQQFAQAPQPQQPQFDIQSQPQVQVQPEQVQSQPQPIQNTEKLNIIDEDLKIEDTEASELLNNIALSDGTPLIDKIQESSGFDNVNISQPQQPVLEKPQTLAKPKEANQQKPSGILDSAMQAAGREVPQIPEVLPQEQSQMSDISSALNNINSESTDSGDFDDISLLSESIEAQEKFREYLVSELAKKNVDINPKNSNEFKLDISERTISMIARTMAKKIAKHVSNIFSADAKNAAQLETIKEENKKLEQRTRELEEQNKKLRLLLTESNKNLNSYKPSIFGLYKKVNPGK